MDDAHISQIIQSGEELSCDLLHQRSGHSYEQGLSGVVIQIDVERLGDDQKVSAENEAIIYLEDTVFISISLINYLKNLSFSLSILDLLRAFHADLDCNFSSILFLIEAFDHLSKTSGP